jgi:hypothetical protein
MKAIVLSNQNSVSASTVRELSVRIPEVLEVLREAQTVVESWGVKTDLFISALSTEAPASNLELISMIESLTQFALVKRFVKRQERPSIVVGCDLDDKLVELMTSKIDLKTFLESTLYYKKTVVKDYADVSVEREKLYRALAVNALIDPSLTIIEESSDFLSLSEKLSEELNVSTFINVGLGKPLTEELNNQVVREKFTILNSIDMDSSLSWLKC